MKRLEGYDLDNQVNEVEIVNLSGKEFRIKIVKMIQDLRQRMEKMQEMFTKDLEELKDRQMNKIY